MDEPLALGDGTAPIRLIDLDRGIETQLLRIGIQPLAGRSTGALRVDPHPAWDRTHTRIAFNDCPDGKRRVFVAGLDAVLRDRCSLLFLPSLPSFLPSLPSLPSCPSCPSCPS
ncbi:MAG: hypothetical protein KA506_02215, partial [Steroidobacteraceae bacterium]|nr:hypothetical protein [Steroidobacteraceae bacterium]